MEKILMEREQSIFNIFQRVLFLSDAQCEWEPTSANKLKTKEEKFIITIWVRQIRK